MRDDGLPSAIPSTLIAIFDAKDQHEAMLNRLGIIGPVILIAFLNATGQTGPTLIGAGYSLPTLRLAPGQITTLFVTGLKTVLPTGFVKATTVPLPTTLAGISVTLNPNTFVGSPVPLLSIQQTPVCYDGNSPTSSGSTPDCLITAITVQMPLNLDLVIYDPLTGTPTTPIPVLVVSENGIQSKAFNVIPVIDNIHILNTCDVTLFGPVEPTTDCNAVVAHGDGTMVTAANPAKAGEEVVVYAVGLGPTTPVVESGERTPSDAPALSRSVYVQFDFRPNAVATRPYHDTATAGIFGFAIPEFVGLTPNQIGLYQINIRLPNTFPTVQPCVNGLSAAGGLTTIVGSNLTIDIGGLNGLGLGSVTSFDGAAICVQTPSN
jgi:uncharacterized protein (TIGR03437 family)